MSDTTTAIKRPGSGRTKGSFSFVKIPMSDVLAKFADQSTQLVVSRKWAEAVGFTNLIAKDAKTTTEDVSGTNPASAVAVKIRDFDNE